MLARISWFANLKLHFTVMVYEVFKLWCLFAKESWQQEANILHIQRWCIGSVLIKLNHFSLSRGHFIFSANQTNFLLWVWDIKERVFYICLFIFEDRSFYSYFTRVNLTFDFFDVVKYKLCSFFTET